MREARLEKSTRKANVAKTSDAMQRHGHRKLQVVAPQRDKEGSLEQQYLDTVDADHRKAYGQFFTPEPLASAMATWVLGCSPSRVIDPAVGTGRLLQPFTDQGEQMELVGFDLDPGPLEFARERFRDVAGVELVQSDFLKIFENLEFDGATCNPPYVRHHLLQYEPELAETLLQEIPKIPRSSNLYVLFVAAIMARLKPGGRASILLPADWMHANYAKSFRQYLKSSGQCKRVVYFTGETRPFEDALTTAALLLFEKGANFKEVEVAVIDADIDSAAVTRLGDETLETAVGFRCHKIEWDSLSSSLKWDVPFRGLSLGAPDGWVPLGELASCSRGIATGANAYFHISERTRESFELPKSALSPCIGRAKDVVGLNFTERDWAELDVQAPRWLLDVEAGSPGIQRYLDLGMDQEIHKRYLCSARKLWFVQEKRAAADLWVGVFGREGIKAILNSARVKNLTTFHGIYLRREEFSEAALKLIPVALSAVLNSTKVQKLSLENQRSYGGGLQKVEPKDVTEFLVPDLRRLPSSDLRKLKDSVEVADKLYRAGAAHWRQPLDEAVEALSL